MLAFLYLIGLYAAISLVLGTIWHFAFQWPWKKVLNMTLSNTAFYAVIYLLVVIGRWVIWGSQ